jgi:hypothetical protein
MRPLLRHPASRAADARHAAKIALAAEAALGEAGALVFRYRLRAEDETFCRLAPHFASRADRVPVRADRLWEHTCFEAFIASGKRSAYREFNFSPSGDWAAYDFSDYRQDRADAAVNAPTIRVRVRPPFLELCACIAHGDWDIFSDDMRLGISAVIETPGVLTYWALRHTRAAPDFHCRDAFLIERADLAEALDG